MSNADSLRVHRDELLSLAHDFGAKNVRVFGSVARGEAGYSSDLDLLVDMEPDRSMFDLIEFSINAEELLRCKVDVVTPAGLSPYLRDRILMEAVYL